MYIINIRSINKNLPTSYGIRLKVINRSNQSIHGRLSRLFSVEINELEQHFQIDFITAAHQILLSDGMKLIEK